MTTIEPTVVELRAVTLTYPGPPPVTALQPCEVTVQRGDHVSVVGRSGSGKSTLLNVIGLLDRPTGGEYLFDGVDTASLDERQRTALRGRHMGFVFQAYHLVSHYTAVENVALAMLYVEVPRRIRAARAREALARVGLAHRADGLAAHLSGGERQRVALARAIVTRPSLVLCDEPTGNLDSASAAAVLDLLDELSTGGLTLIVVTHDPSVAARGRRILEIDDGVVRERSRRC